MDNANQKLELDNLSTQYTFKGEIRGGTSALGVSRIIVDIETEQYVQNALYSLRAQVPNRDPIMLNEAQYLSDQEILDLSTYIFFQRH